MSHTNDKPIPRCRAIGGIRLFAGGGHWLAMPPPHGRPGTPPAFHPFVLPRVPRFLLDWLATGGRRVWHERQRCMAALLLLDCRGGGWWTIRLPRQRCGPDAACWSARRSDLPEDLPSTLRLGGTFQTLAAIGQEQLLLDAVPTTADGVHLVLPVGYEERGVCCFVRAGGQARPAPGQAVVADDWADAIELALPRLRLA